MRLRRLVPVLLVLGLLPLATVQAQFDKEYKSWYPHIAVGYSIPLAEFDDLAQDGFSINGGVTYKPSDWAVGVIMDLAYSDYNLERSFLDVADSSGGDSDVWSLTAGGIWAPTSGGKVGFYLSAMLGVYRLNAKLTEPSSGCFLCCDPWWPWYCYCCTGGTIVTGSRATTELGGSLAAGLTFKVSDMGSTIFLECKYNYVNTSHNAAQYVPISVGYRW